MDLTITNQVINFYESFLLGNPVEPVTSSETQFILDGIRQRLNAHVVFDNIAKRGGLLSWIRDILRDLDQIAQHVEERNRHFLTQGLEENAKSVRLSTAEARQFHDRLSRSCRGNLSNGCLSNSFLYRQLYAAFYKEDAFTVFQMFFPDESKEDHLLLNEFLQHKIVPARFSNAQFWGTVAVQCLSRNPREIAIPDSFVRDIQTHYQLKCLALGRVVDPFGLELVPSEQVIDRVHFTSVDTAIEFMKQNPNHPVTKITKSCCARYLRSLLDADVNILPRGLLPTEESTIEKLCVNISNLHKCLPQVPCCTPPLIVDVIHRLLALTGYDVAWEKVPDGESVPDVERSDRLSLYFKYIECKKKCRYLKEVLTQYTK